MFKKKDNSNFMSVSYIHNFNNIHAYFAYILLAKIWQTIIVNYNIHLRVVIQIFYAVTI